MRALVMALPLVTLLACAPTQRPGAPAGAVATATPDDAGLAAEETSRDGGAARAAPPALPRFRWSDGVALVVEGWQLDPAQATFTAGSGRRVQGARIHVAGAAPATGVADPKGQRRAWARAGQVCIAAIGVDGYDCYPVPPPAVDDAAHVEAALRDRLSAASACWRPEARRCVRWSLAAGAEGSFTLSRFVAGRREAYTVRPLGRTVSIDGPDETEATASGTRTRATGETEARQVGAIAEDSVQIGGERWFFSEAACRGGLRPAAATSPGEL